MFASGSNSFRIVDRASIRFDSESSVAVTTDFMRASSTSAGVGTELGLMVTFPITGRDLPSFRFMALDMDLRHLGHGASTRSLARMNVTLPRPLQKLHDDLGPACLVLPLLEMQSLVQSAMLVSGNAFTSAAGMTGAMVPVPRISLNHVSALMPVMTSKSRRPHFFSTSSLTSLSPSTSVPVGATSAPCVTSCSTLVLTLGSSSELLLKTASVIEL